MSKWPIHAIILKPQALPFTADNLEGENKTAGQLIEAAGLAQLSGEFNLPDQRVFLYQSDRLPHHLIEGGYAINLAMVRKIVGDNQERQAGYLLELLCVFGDPLAREAARQAGGIRALFGPTPESAVEDARAKALYLEIQSAQADWSARKPPLRSPQANLPRATDDPEPRDTLEQIRQRYPAFHNADIDVNAGWAALLDDLGTYIEAQLPEPLRVIDISQKHGVLRIAHPPIADSHQCTLFTEFKRRLERRSSTTCELCGRPGSPTPNRNGWIRTVCDDHLDPSS